MRIVIDMQGAQSLESRHRGIGRYTFSLAQALARNHPEHDIFLALSGLFPSSIEVIRAAFDGLIPQNNIHVWYAPSQVSFLNQTNHWRRQTAELIREAFLTNLNPDVILVSSLFEGLVDDAVTSIGEFTRRTPVATVLYDLIPYIYRKPYLENPIVETWYATKLDHLRRANMLLAISESSRQEAIKYLGFSDNAVYNISTAADIHFTPRNISPIREREIRNKYKLHLPYILYTGGIDYRKNVDGLIRAYSKLPQEVRRQHQLAIVCSIQEQNRLHMENLAQLSGLEKHELVITGFVPENDLVDVYNLCKLFVFPSWHEGFGLPALEAMSCGKAVIGANISSIPEVIGREDALFDPRSDEEITGKLNQVLTNENFRNELERHGLEQAKRFSWDHTAKRTTEALEHWQKEQNHPFKRSSNIRSNDTRLRPRLAYLSPLPPERSGISDYSAELLPELSRFYDIDVIVSQDTVSDTWVKAICNIRSIDWFRKNSDRFDRILYHFGNSIFHYHMFDLLTEIPGTVVLHDFFLSGILAHMEVHGLTPDAWTTELYRSHGYHAVKERYAAKNLVDVIWKYPCSFSVLQNARGIISHSEYSLQLTQKWFNHSPNNNWAVIPLLRASRTETERASARHELGLKEDDFVVCSFGIIGPTKLNHRLLEAWIETELATRTNAYLIFVGENHPNDYGRHLIEVIDGSGMSDRISITGWVNTTKLHQYLSAADVAVQLRTLSRGETSAAVLDCMNYGIATIVNAHGSLAELPEDAVWMLPDNFEDNQLINALETLWQDSTKRVSLGDHANKIIKTQHNPRTCAHKYYETIEHFYQASGVDFRSLVEVMASLEKPFVNQDSLEALSEDIARTFPSQLQQKQLFVDISELVTRDYKTGIQRVVRSILKEWLANPPKGWRVEPVFASADAGYCYARQFTIESLGCTVNSLYDEPIEYQAGDIFLVTEFYPQVAKPQRLFYQRMRQHGVQVKFIVYDLLCLQIPQFFFESVVAAYKEWLDVVLENDGVICISRSVAEELSSWVKEHGLHRLMPFSISWFHLGADFASIAPTLNASDHHIDELPSILTIRPAFLMVGTVEPRKGYAQTLSAFEQLWMENKDLNLIIVGKPGWMVESLVERFRTHPELGNRLFWFENASDVLLQKVYTIATCLISAAEGEGFGLPLIEASQHNLPIIARDIPVFREVTGNNAFFFRGETATELVNSINEWLELYTSNEHPRSENISWLTWKQSADWLKEIILEDDWHIQIKLTRPQSDQPGLPQSLLTYPELKLEKINDVQVSLRRETEPDTEDIIQDRVVKDLRYLEYTVDYEQGIDRGSLANKEVIVYAPPRTGTSTLYWTIANYLQPLRKWQDLEKHMLHNYSNSMLFSVLRLPNNMDMKELSERFLIRDLLNYKKVTGGQAQFITSFRDPLERAISDVFHEAVSQVFKNEVCDLRKLDLKDMAFDLAYRKLQNSMQIYFDQHHPLEEIDNLFFERFSFDHSTKSCYVRWRGNEILALCLEHSSRWQEALERHFGYHRIEIVSVNVTGDQKKISSAYHDFKKNLELPHNLIKKIYYENHRLGRQLRWFYTEDEIQSFYQRALEHYGSNYKQIDKA